MQCRSEYDSIEPYERPRVFCASLADVFEDWTGPMTNAGGDVIVRPHLDSENTWKNWDAVDADTLRIDSQCWKPVTMGDVRARLFRLIHETPNLDWLLLTKRPENVARHLGRYAERLDTYAAEAFSLIWNRRVWLGTSVENQATADERIPHLLRTPAAVRFLSCEPLLGAVDLSPFHIGWLRCANCGEGRDPTTEQPLGTYFHCSDCEADGSLVIDGHHLHWVIVGGESGPGARPCNVSWVKSIVDQCKAASVACFVKQLGAVSLMDVGFPSPKWDRSFSVPVVAENGRVTLKLADRKGGDIEEFPADLRVRQFPTARMS